MRDPVIYRVARMTHHNTGEKWCIYPMYDFAHPIEDAIEGITHSLCTLEFEDHRPLYDWVVRECEYKNPPRQIEFAKLYLTNVVTGKRYIKKLVEDKIVDGWDDPRLVSIAALRRRGYTPESIRNFVKLAGVSKADSSIESAMLEYCIREDLKLKKPRIMAILDPIKLIIDNYPENQSEICTMPNNLENPELVTDVRNMLGFTGTYKGKRISVQGTGMGIPSMSIYITELMKDYGVKTLIRVGSAGSYQEDVKIRDIVVALSTSTDSNINNRRFKGASFAPTVNFDLLSKVLKTAEEKNIKIKAGNILTSDEFYNDDPSYFKKWAEFGVLAVEMETAALYTLASKYKAKALSILTISDSLVSPEITSSEEREKTFNEMIELALETAIK